MGQSLRTARRGGLASTAAVRPRLAAVVACFCALTMSVAGQQPPGSKTGNPTPGTPQPEPPNLADRITLTGCVQAAGAPAAGRPAAAIEANSPSDSRFVLVKAARIKVVPPDTGTSPAAASAASGTYRLHAIDTQLSPFVGTRVEISGEILPSPASEAGAPTLQVEFVQKVASSCS